MDASPPSFIIRLSVPPPTFPIIEMLNEFGSGSVIVADSRNPFMWKRLCCDRQTNADIGRSVIVGLRFVIYIHLVFPPQGIGLNCSVSLWVCLDGCTQRFGCCSFVSVHKFDSELHTPKMYFSNFMIHFSLIVVCFYKSLLEHFTLWKCEFYVKLN